MPQSPNPNTPPTPAPTPAPTLADAYDIGPDPSTPTEALPQPAPESASAPAPASSRPRNPDGTFAPVEPETPPAPRHSARVLGMAKDYGVPQATIDTASSDQLEEVVYQLHRQYLDLTKQHLIKNTVEAGVQRQQPPAPPVPQESPIDWGTGADGAKFAAEDFHPGIQHIVKSLTQRIAQLEARVNNVQGFQQQQVARTQTEECDNFFRQYPEIYGSESYEELDKNSDEFFRRRQVSLGTRDIPGQFPTKQKLQKIHNKIYPGSKTAKPAELPAQIQAATNAELAAWNAAGLAKPTQRKVEEEEPGVRKATRELSKALKERAGQVEESNGEASLDDFPE